MTITANQLTYLKEMGIQPWQRKSISTDASSSQVSSDKNIIEVSLSQLLELQFFKDVLISLKVSPADISWQNDCLDLGLFNWQFVEQSPIGFNNTTLTTPSLSTITEQAGFKRLLWKELNQHNLVSKAD